MKRARPEITDRHIRWNFEQSPDNPEKTLLHLVVVDNRFLPAIIERVLSQDAISFGSTEQVREVEGKVKGCRLKYLFRTYEGNIDPRMIKWDKTGKIAFQDTDLRERISPASSIEEYVEKIYSN
jgi:hypothetical protein